VPHRKVPAVRLLVLDVDGVLTDGSILYDDEGREIKRFNVRDGFGIHLWHQAGFEIAIVTGRSGGALRARMGELGVERVMEGVEDKAEAVRRLASETGVGLGEMAYLGDDWTDAPAMRLVGYPMAVGAADVDVRDLAIYRTVNEGGHGAVREAIAWLLSRAGLLDEARERYGLPPRPQIEAPGAASTRPPPREQVPRDPDAPPADEPI